MKQGRIRVLACVLVMLAAIAPTIAIAASKSAKTAASTATRRASIHQFSGWITAMDKTSLTVEKRGKNPRTMTFVRDGETLSSGEIEKDAHVTVYYRDVDGHATAHRVVAKGAGRTTRAAKAANDD
jgi:hypothetical protein